MVFGEIMGDGVSLLALQVLLYQDEPTAFIRCFLLFTDVYNAIRLSLIFFKPGIRFTSLSLFFTSFHSIQILTFYVFLCNVPSHPSPW